MVKKSSKPGKQQGKKGGEFQALYLRPRGLGQDHSTESIHQSEKLTTRAINEYRKTGMQALYMARSHQERHEEAMLSKHAFLLKRINEAGNEHSVTFHKEQLIYLLADWHTLFRRSRQDYQHDREFYNNLRKEMGESHQEHVEYAINKAVDKVTDVEAEKKYRRYLSCIQAKADEKQIQLEEWYRDLCSAEPWHNAATPELETLFQEGLAQLDFPLVRDFSGLGSTLSDEFLEDAREHIQEDDVLYSTFRERFVEELYLSSGGAALRYELLIERFGLAELPHLSEAESLQLFADILPMYLSRLREIPMEKKRRVIINHSIARRN